MIRNHKQGDVYFADLGHAVGSEQGGTRPVVIMQNDIGNRHSYTVTVVPLTSKKKPNNMPTHTLIEMDGDNGLKFDSLALGEQITTISVERIGRKIGRISNKDYRAIWGAVLNQISSPETKFI